MIHQFGNCELDTEQHELRVNGVPQALEPQVFRLLEVLIENRNRIVTRDELMETVWQGRIVSDSTLATRISSARQAIGDSGERQAYIQTVHGCGYRFAGSLVAATEAPIGPSASIEVTPTPEAAFSTRWSALCTRLRSGTPFGAQRLQWLVVVLVVVGLGLVVWRLLPSTNLPKSVARTSIAVLPFEDLSEAEDQKYFADGVAEELRSALARVKDLQVAGRISSLVLKDQNADVQTIGVRLKVAAVLEGSIRRSQDRVRITIQLVDTSSGYQLWSETYDQQMQDIFTIQDDIARAVVHRLNIERREEDPSRPLVAQETGNLEAYRLYLQGRYLWKRRIGDNLPRAIKFFNEAIALDPDFARAHSALAATYVVLSGYTRADRDASYDTAERTAHTALKLNPELSEPHAVLGWLYSKRYEWSRAERWFQRAVALEPVDPVTYLWYGDHSRNAGRMRQALAQYEKALAMDPAWGIIVSAHSAALYALEQRETAMKGGAQAVALDYFRCHMLLRDIAYEMGDLDKAIDHHVEYWRHRGYSEDQIEKSRRVYEASLGLAGPQSVFVQETEALLQSGQLALQDAFFRFYHARQVDRAMALFDIKADREFYGWLRKFWWPYGRPIRTHPRFASIVADLGLIPYWREFGWPEQCGPDPKHGVQCH